MIARYTRPEMAQIWSEQFRWETILEVELLAAEAMARRGRLDWKSVRTLRKKSRVRVARIREIEKTVKHDVVAFLTHIEEQAGPAAKALHAGLTSSDVLDTALAVQLKKSTELLTAGLKELQSAARRLALRHRNTVMMGRTHGVHAEPITFGLKAAGWYAELKRDMARLRSAGEEVAVGKISGAVGTFAHVDMAVESEVCRRLGLRAEPVSTQIVPRDRHAFYLQTLAVVGAGLERIATEIRHLQRTEALEVEEPFSAGQKGSSAMPHKRNPVASENICGLARLLRAYAGAALENVALWHERDISHSSVERVILPDAAAALDFAVHRLADVLNGLQVYPDRMRTNMAKTAAVICSQRLVVSLAQKGLPKQKAYDLVQRHAQRAWKSGEDFWALVGSDPRIVRRLSKAELRRCSDLSFFLKSVGRIIHRALF
ncbi:MAG TPA: adenylosuccinate lyase [Elusimicrobiota bacterium]|nr:adenylosuccinate lyase [Elusimicrobiota bacterium]